MELWRKFEQGKERHTYQRIDSEYRVNIFLGYNENGNMSMVLTEPGQNMKIKSSKMINVKLRRREDGKMALSFELLEKSYASMFLIFCKDMIIVCEKAGSSMAISNAIVRWKYWLEMFGKKQSRLLDKNEIRGLIGELIELKNHFIPDAGVSAAIDGWMGPLLGHKDFEIFDTWYEIKCVNEGALQVTVSSLEQLDSDIEGHLAIVCLEEASAVSTASFNLNQLILRIMDMVKEPDDMEKFRIKLDNMGYAADAEYDNYNFIYKGTQRYKINEKFPRLTRKDVGSSIGNVKYTLLLNGIKNYME